jgi:hypothetical protein
LVWGRGDRFFQLAVEAAIPKELRERTGTQHGIIRYEMWIGPSCVPDRKTVTVLGERLSLTSESRELDTSPPERVMQYPWPNFGMVPIIYKEIFGETRFWYEQPPIIGQAHLPLNLPMEQTGLANLPADDTRFPISLWFRNLLVAGVQSLAINSDVLRNPSPYSRSPGFRPDGSNLPWVVERLSREAPARFAKWIAHLRVVLPDLVGLRTVVRPEDRHAYLVLQFAGGLEVPSWGASDGTLRLLALTLPAYLPSSRGIYLVEEPENGVHPGAVQAVMDSLSSVYEGQVLVTTHSPVVVSLIEPKDILCFSKAESGETKIVRGDKHPGLEDWRGTPNLSVLFASGVLG